MQGFFIVCLAVLILFCIALYWGIIVEIVYFVWPPLKRKQKREDDEKRKEWERQRKQEILDYLRDEVQGTFHVELDSVHDSGTQNEIVRLVNLLAHEAAVACVNQDKEGRGKRVPKPDDYTPDWSYVVGERKIKWAEARNLALRIAPELKDRLPHFSEFEPLKSYREEHLLQKEAKRRSTSK